MCGSIELVTPERQFFCDTFRVERLFFFNSTGSMLTGMHRSYFICKFSNSGFFQYTKLHFWSVTYVVMTIFVVWYQKKKYVLSPIILCLWMQWIIFCFCNTIAQATDKKHEVRKRVGTKYGYQKVFCNVNYVEKRKNATIYDFLTDDRKKERRKKRYTHAEPV